jgi:hypothetical protein
METAELPAATAGATSAAPEALPVGRLTEIVAPAGSEHPAAPDVDALARQVYALLKVRLRAERDRHW